MNHISVEKPGLDVTQTVVLPNTRPHQVCWGEWEMVYLVQERQSDGWLYCTYSGVQCSHQDLQAKGHKQYLMTTPLILNIIIVSTKNLFLVYHCQYDSQSNLIELGLNYSELRHF